MTEAELLIIGNGMACQRLLRELLHWPGRPTRIVILAAEDRPAYNRVLLSNLLSGEQADSAAELGGIDWYRQHGFELFCGDAVVQLDAANKRVLCQSGQRYRYQQLVLACGADAIRPNYALNPQGELHHNISHFRNWQDLQQLRAASQHHQQAVVVGGGFLGLEAAAGLQQLGMQVRLIQRGASVLNRQLDRPAALMLQQALANKGIEIHTRSQLSGLSYRQGQLHSIRLHDGRRFEAQWLVLALGIRPATRLAQQAGLRVNRGICVNDKLQSSRPDIYALGECIEYQGETFGLLAPIQQQARVLAAVLCGQPDRYQPATICTQLKISGIAVSSCGDIAALSTDPSRSDHSQVYQDHQLGHYRRLWWKNQILQGAVLFGDTRLSPFYSDLIRSGQPYRGDSHSALFNPADQAA